MSMYYSARDHKQAADELQSKGVLLQAAMVRSYCVPCDRLLTKSERQAGLRVKREMALAAAAYNAASEAFRAVSGVFN